MIKQIAKKAYDNYRIQWMVSHGYSIDDFVNELSKFMQECDESMKEAFDIWEQECGFNGCIWSCFDEFLVAEFMHEEYIFHLINQADYEEYVRLRCVINSLKVVLKKDKEGYVLVCSARDDMMGIFTYHMDRNVLEEALERSDPPEYIKSVCEETLLVPGDEGYWDYLDALVTDKPTADYISFVDSSGNE